MAHTEVTRTNWEYDLVIWHLDQFQLVFMDELNVKGGKGWGLVEVIRKDEKTIYFILERLKTE